MLSSNCQDQARGGSVLPRVWGAQATINPGKSIFEVLRAGTASSDKGTVIPVRMKPRGGIQIVSKPLLLSSFSFLFIPRIFKWICLASSRCHTKAWHMVQGAESIIWLLLFLLKLSGSGTEICRFKNLFLLIKKPLKRPLLFIKNVSLSCHFYIALQHLSIHQCHYLLHNHLISIFVLIWAHSLPQLNMTGGKEKAQHHFKISIYKRKGRSPFLLLKSHWFTFNKLGLLVWVEAGKSLLQNILISGIFHLDPII